MSKRGEGRARGRPRQSSQISLAACRRLDRQSAIPLYYQLAATLYEHLEVGDWEAGIRFATERELEEEFEVSRAVVRRALLLLEGDGAIERSRGRGAFVAPRRVQVQLFGLIDYLIHGRDGIAVEIMSIREDGPDPAIADFLSLDDADAPIARVAALLHAADRAVGLIDSHVPTSRLPGLVGLARSLGRSTNRQASLPVELTKAEVLVEHTSFSAWSGPLLGAKAGEPAFMTRLIQYGRATSEDAECALEFARLVHPSHRAQLIGTLAQ